MQPRPTVYKGIQMRSRLEALFAQRLDTEPPLGLLSWSYEPECYASPEGQYLPDFRMDYVDDTPIFVEVKPPTADALEALGRMHVILASEPDADLAVYVSDGGYPSPTWSVAASCRPEAPCCSRRSAEPLLAWEQPHPAHRPVSSCKPDSAISAPLLSVLCAWCRRPAPKIVRVDALPMADDPDGLPVLVVVRMRCDHCADEWHLNLAVASHVGRTSIMVKPIPEPKA